MNQKQEIIKFLKDSNKLIYKIIKEEYYNEEDFKEIESWTDQTIQNIYEFWLNYIMKGEGYVGIFFSPWCIQQAIPPLGCGNGGLNWNDVKPLITRKLGHLSDVRIVIFEPSLSIWF